MTRYGLFFGPAVFLGLAAKNWWFDRPAHVVFFLGLTVLNLAFLVTLGFAGRMRRRRFVKNGSAA